MKKMYFIRMQQIFNECIFFSGKFLSLLKISFSRLFNVFPKRTVISPSGFSAGYYLECFLENDNLISRISNNIFHSLVLEECNYVVRRSVSWQLFLLPNLLKILNEICCFQTQWP